MKIRFNSPLILTFTIICCLVMMGAQLLGDQLVIAFFSVHPGIQASEPMWYWRLFSHVLGHSDWIHFMGNFSMILLLGPLLEEKYGAWILLEMMLITAVITGLINACFFSSILLGASGIVFMMILLASFSNFQDGEIPLTFVLVATFYLGQEIIHALEPDKISQMAHIVGGLCGALFGFKRKIFSE